jgi:flagellar motor switch protein FliN/FliY
MTELEQRPDIGLKGFFDPPSQAFAEVLGEILDAAMASYREIRDRNINCSVALVSEIPRDDLSRVIDEMPVVAEIELSTEMGERAAILFDIPTATKLANYIVSGHVEKDVSARGQHISSLHEFLRPIVTAFTGACEEAAGRTFGSLRAVTVFDKNERELLFAQLPDVMIRALASITAGDERAGKMALLLPVNLVEILAESRNVSSRAVVGPYERMELEQMDDAADRFHRQGEREPSVENMDMILDIQLKLHARLGQVEMPIGEIMKLTPGSVIDIDRLVDEPIELVVNDRPIARGEIVVVQENFGIKITEIISPKDRIQSLR